MSCPCIPLTCITSIRANIRFLNMIHASKLKITFSMTDYYDGSLAISYDQDCKYPIPVHV